MENIFIGEYFEAKNIQNLLEIENIKVFVANQYMSGIEPWVVSPGGFNPIILKVNNEDFEQANKLVEEYRNGKFNI